MKTDFWVISSCLIALGIISFLIAIALSEEVDEAEEYLTL